MFPTISPHLPVLCIPPATFLVDAVGCALFPPLYISHWYSHDECDAPSAPPRVCLWWLLDSFARSYATPGTCGRDRRHDVDFVIVFAGVTHRQACRRRKEAQVRPAQFPPSLTTTNAHSTIPAHTTPPRYLHLPHNLTGTTHTTAMAAFLCSCFQSHRSTLTAPPRKITMSPAGSVDLKCNHNYPPLCLATTASGVSHSPPPHPKSVWPTPAFGQRTVNPQRQGGHFTTHIMPAKLIMPM